MDETPKQPSPNSLRCETHNLRHGPAGCPICLRAAAPEPVVLLPVQDTSLSFVDALAEFWRLYGMKSIGLLAMGIGAVYTLAWPSPTKAIDATPYQQPIVELESVLFYAGPTDPQEHQKMLLTLLPAVVTAIKAHPPAYRAEFLVGALEETAARVKHADMETFRLTFVRKGWIRIREDFFDDAVWFRSRDDRLDAAQNQVAGGLPAGQTDPGAMAALDSSFRLVEGFVARAGYLASQACADGGDKTGLSAEYRSLSADTTAQLEALVAGNETVKAQLQAVTSSARTLVRSRQESDCATGVPSASSINRNFAAFQSTVDRVRSSLRGH